MQHLMLPKHGKVQATQKPTDLLDFVSKVTEIQVNIYIHQIVIYNSKNAAVWSTNVSSKDKPFRLEMQDDGNLVTYNKDSKANWALW